VSGGGELLCDRAAGGR